MKRKNIKALERADEINRRLKAADVYNVKYKWALLEKPKFRKFNDFIAILPEIEIHTNDARFKEKTFDIQIHFLNLHACFKWIRTEKG